MEASEKLSPFKEKLALIIVLGTIGLMLFENVIGIKMYLIACIGAVLLVLTGVLSEKEALNSIHQPTIFLFAASTISYTCFWRSVNLPFTGYVLVISEL